MHTFKRLHLALLLYPALVAAGVSEPLTSSLPLESKPIDLDMLTTPLDPASYTSAPPGLALKQVHVFVRHGERTPVSVRMSNPPASIPEHWSMCTTARRFRAAVHGTGVVVGGLAASEEAAKDSGVAVSEGSVPAGIGAVAGWDEESLNMRKVVERADGTSSSDECLLGELTDIGRQSTYNFGVALRQLYIDRLGFLPDVIGNNGQTYFRSTNMPRTIESLQHVIHGLYPTSKRENEAMAQILIRNGKDENLIGNSYACKRLEMLLAGFADAAASAYNPLLAALDSKISKYIDGSPLRVDGHPRASGVMDTVRAAIANGVKVPPEFHEKATVDTIEKAVVSEWFNGYRIEEVRRLGMGRLLGDLSRRMEHKAAKGDADPLKILVHSTHDTGIAALLSTLDVFDGKWPAFTASMTFELFQAQNVSENAQAEVGPTTKAQSVLGALRLRNATAADHYVRVRYQNKTLPLPICAEEGKHLEGSPEFCTLEAFRERMAELTPVDWNAECAPRGMTG